MKKTLDEMLQCGQKIKVFYNEGNINNEIRHIRAIVDGCKIVYRVWRPKSGWVYFVTDRYEFELRYENGKLSQ